MDRKDNMPMWVFLALASIDTRKIGMMLVWACLIFALGFLPLPLLLDNWTWLEVLEWSGVLYPMTLWYWLSIRWVDKHSSWDTTETTTTVDE